jgi:hypothetical protein
MKTWLWILLGVSSVVGVERAEAQSLETNRTVLPPGFENQPGNANGGLLLEGQTYQQMFPGSSFDRVTSTPIKITGIAFRVEEKAAAGYLAVIPRVEIHLSTSARSLEQMSTSWNLNKGPDEAMVYLHDNVSLFGAAAQPVSPFDLRFQLDTPFVYDPKSGNLAMMFIVASTPGRASTIDAHFFSEQNSPSMAFGPGFLVPTPYGVITEFSFIAVPEPKTSSLVCGGAAVVLGIGMRRRRSSKC